MKRYALALLPLALSACSDGTVRDTLGISRKAPDEFRVVSRPPLSVPPEFNLRPPAAPGEVVDGAETPAPQQAQGLLFGESASSGLRAGSADTAVQPVTSDSLATTADEQFLKNAGADQANSAARQELQRETALTQGQERSLLQKLREPGNSEPTVNPEAEAERLKQNKAENKPVTEGETPTAKQKDTGTLGRIFGY